MNRKYIGYLLYTIIGIAVNGYVFSNGGSVMLVGGSLVSIPILILTVEKFTRRFDYPLFFIRDDGLNLWGGAFGAVSAALFYVIGLLTAGPISSLDFLSFIFLLTTAFTLVIILWTATLLRDIEMGYVEVNSDLEEE